MALEWNHPSEGISGRDWEDISRLYLDGSNT